MRENPTGNFFGDEFKITFIVNPQEEENFFEKVLSDTHVQQHSQKMPDFPVVANPGTSVAD